MPPAVSVDVSRVCFRVRKPTGRAAACLSIALALAGGGTGAHADESAPASAPSSWTFGGFGTLGVVHSSEREADFTSNVLNPGTAGHSRRWSADVDSRLGAQLSWNPTPAWSAVLQLVSERSLTDSYIPMVEWANLKYQLTPDLSVRLGRIALPLFLAGDYRKVSYALPWVRPPVELYGAIPLTSSDGIDASYRWSMAGVNNTSQLSFGHADLDVGNQSHARARQLVGLSNLTTIGALTVRASVLNTKLDVDLARQLFDGLRQFGPQGVALADRYGVNAKRTSVTSIGFNYDPGEWFVMGEVARMKAHSFLGDKTASYLTGGYRYGNLTPYATYARVVANMETRVDGLSLAQLPPQLAGIAAQLNGGLNSLLSSVSRQQTSSVGLRWDFHANYGLTLQYDRLEPDAGSSGTLINVQPGFRADHAISVLSAALAFVF
jgi:hypothetical protein